MVKHEPTLFRFVSASHEYKGKTWTSIGGEEINNRVVLSHSLSLSLSSLSSLIIESLVPSPR